MTDISSAPKVEKVQPTKPGAFKRFMRWFFFSLFVFLAAFIYWKYYYPFTDDGVKSGYLNYTVRKGQIFKTYEGKLIQEGIKTRSGMGIQSNEFEFSVTDDSIANVLMNNSGNYFDLHYKEYKGTIPWRGFSPYIVDKIISMKPVER